MYGQNHRYCPTCGHAVHSGYRRSCTGCGTPFGELMMLDMAMNQGIWDCGGPSIGFDMTDGDLVENFGGGFGIDLDTGQPEIDMGGFDIPL